MFSERFITLLSVLRSRIDIGTWRLLLRLSSSPNAAGRFSRAALTCTIAGYLFFLSGSTLFYLALDWLESTGFVVVASQLVRRSWSFSSTTEFANSLSLSRATTEEPLLRCLGPAKGPSWLGDTSLRVFVDRLRDLLRVHVLY